LRQSTALIRPRRCMAEAIARGDAMLSVQRTGDTMAIEAQTSDRPFRNLKNVTPSDTSDAVNVRPDARGIITLTAGNVSLVDANGETLSFVGLGPATIIPCETIKRVRVTGTTANVADGL
jgi:hypothetical protein